MNAMKGSTLFPAQFADVAAQFNSLPAIARWIAEQGYKGIRLKIIATEKSLFGPERTNNNKQKPNFEIGDL